MRLKIKYSDDITAHSIPMGKTAELLWVKAFQQLGYNIEDQNKNEYNGITSTLNNNIDIIVKRGDVVFGVEIKNGMSYPSGLALKFQVAAELGMVPIIVTRNLRYSDRLFIIRCGGKFKIYQTSIYEKRLEAELKSKVKTLGYPILFRDKIDDRVIDHLNGILEDAIFEYDELLEKCEIYLSSI